MVRDLHFDFATTQSISPQLLVAPDICPIFSIFPYRFPYMFPYISLFVSVYFPFPICSPAKSRPFGEGGGGKCRVPRGLGEWGAGAGLRAAGRELRGAAPAPRALLGEERGGGRRSRAGGRRRGGLGGWGLGVRGGLGEVGGGGWGGGPEPFRRWTLKSGNFVGSAGFDMLRSRLVWLEIDGFDEFALHVRGKLSDP